MPPKPACASERFNLTMPRTKKPVDSAITWRKAGGGNSRHSLRPLAGKRAALSRRPKRLCNLESEFLPPDANESQAEAQISKSEADPSMRA